MAISGVVITCRTGRTKDVVSSIVDSGVAEIHAATHEGKVVAVIDAPTFEEEERIVRLLAVMEGVVDVQLAYHHFEEVLDPIGNC